MTPTVALMATSPTDDNDGDDFDYHEDDKSFQLRALQLRLRALER